MHFFLDKKNYMNYFVNKVFKISNKGDHMETQAIKSEKFTGVLDDLINSLIDHDFTLKEAQIFLQSPDILSDMMEQFMARDLEETKLRKVVHSVEHVLGFIKEKCPIYANLLDSIGHREIEHIFFSLMQRREVYDRYKNWCIDKNMRPLKRLRFYETLESLKFRLRNEKDHGLDEKAQGLSGRSPL